MTLENNESQTLIHESLLDTDYYQFLMLQLIYYCWHSDDENLAIKDSQGNLAQEPNVTYELFQRGTIKILGEEYPGLPQLLDEKDLRQQFNHIQNLKFTPDEIEYLASLMTPGGKKVFSSEFLAWLEQIKLPEVSIENLGTHFEISVTGEWHQSLIWETFIMSTVTELLTRNILSQMSQEEKVALQEKVDEILEQNILDAIEGGVVFAEFGTRRRASRDWQEHVVKRLKETLTDEANPGKMIGTSNVALAKKLDLQPIGTMAHQLYMIFASYFASQDDSEGKLNSQSEVVNKWWELYGHDKSIWLPDTYTTLAFLEVVDPQIMLNSKGFRQDSGDPNEFAQRIYDYLVAKYTLLTNLSAEEIQAEIKKKIMLFSDGLKMKEAGELKAKWNDKFTVSFGIGTSLTNNLGPNGTKTDIAVKPITSEFIDPETLQKVERGVLKVSDAPINGSNSKLTGDNGAKKRFLNLIEKTLT